MAMMTSGVLQRVATGVMNMMDKVGVEPQMVMETMSVEAVTEVEAEVALCLVVVSVVAEEITRTAVVVVMEAMVVAVVVVTGEVGEWLVVPEEDEEDSEVKVPGATSEDEVVAVVTKVQGRITSNSSSSRSIVMRHGLPLVPCHSSVSLRCTTY